MLLLDTDIASAFAKAGHFDALINLFRSVGITTSVYEELLTLSEDEQKEYLKIKEKHAKIGKGESESIVVCLNRGYLFSSFDKKAIMVAKAVGVEIITAGVVFKGLSVKGIATKEEILKIIRDIESSDNRVVVVEL
jgi:predicted nucleic acid-binding protein